MPVRHMVICIHSILWWIFNSRVRLRLKMYLLLYPYHFEKCFHDFCEFEAISVQQSLPLGSIDRIQFWSCGALDFIIWQNFAVILFGEKVIFWDLLLLTLIRIYQRQRKREVKPKFMVHHVRSLTNKCYQLPTNGKIY